MNNNALDETVYLTFPTTRGTLELLNQIATIKKVTQPKLLDMICQDYINKSAKAMIQYFIINNIDINENI